MGLKENELVAKLGTLTVKTGKRRAPEEIKVVEEEEEEPVSPAARLFHEPGFNCHIIYAVGIGTPVDVNVLKSGLQSTLLHHPRFSSIPAYSELMAGKNRGLKWGNQLGYCIVPFPIVKYEDPLQYILKGKAIADRKKKSLEAIFTFKGGLLIVKCFGMKVAAALCKRTLFNTTFSFSNLVGPVEEIGFYGHPIAYLAPSVYGHPHALTVHFQSYMNMMTIVLGVDVAAIPDPHQLLDDFSESLKLIKKAIPAKSS